MNIDEKMKHRVIGLAVVIALVVLFIPFFWSAKQPRVELLETSAVTPPLPPSEPLVDIELLDASFSQSPIAQVNLDDDTIIAEVPVEEVVDVISAPVIDTPEIVEADIKEQPVTNYSVQIASFSNQANADQLVTRLIANGFSVETDRSANSKGVIITRVLVGRLASKQEANELLARLKQSTQLQGLVVRRQSTA